MLYQKNQNVADTRQEKISSMFPYEEELLEKNFEINMLQQIASQLDIVQFNSNEVVKNCGTDNLSQYSLTRTCRNFSVHSPLRTETTLKMGKLPYAATKQYSFKKTDWEKFSWSEENQPFQP